MKSCISVLVVVLAGGLTAADELVPKTHGNAVPAFVVFGRERHRDLSFLVDRGFAVLTSDAAGPDAQIEAIQALRRRLDDDERIDKWLLAFVGSSLTPEQLCDLHPTLTLPRQRAFQALADWEARIAFLDAHGWRSYAVKPDKRIPDLLTTFAGEKVTDVAMWERVRRPELRDFFERNVYGKRPVERPEGLAFRDLHPPKSVYGGLGFQRTVEISWPGRYRPGKFTTIFYYPAKAKKPVPAFAYLSLRELAPDVLRHEVWAVSNLLARGIASAAFRYKDVAPDWGGEKPHDNFASGVYACFEKPSERTPESWGAISAWAWGLSRVMDFLETVPEVDAKRVRTVGLSRGGKTALWAAAVDERFEGACATGSGCCGAGMNAIFLPGEDLNRIHARFPYWFCGNFAKYAKSSEQQYPGYDQHQMLALIAPRHLYVSESLRDTPRFGDFEGVRWSAPAWELYGLPTLKGATFPELEKPIRAGHQSFHLRHGFHDLTFYDWMRYADDICR